MARATRDPDDGQAGVEFVHEDDGSITARDLETGLACGDDSRAAALAQLAEVLALHEGRGEPVTDADLREMGLDREAVGEELAEVLALHEGRDGPVTDAGVGPQKLWRAPTWLLPNAFQST